MEKLGICLQTVPNVFRKIANQIEINSPLVNRI